MKLFQVSIFFSCPAKQMVSVKCVGFLEHMVCFSTISCVVSTRIALRWVWLLDQIRRQYVVFYHRHWMVFKTLSGKQHFLLELLKGTGRAQWLFFVTYLRVMKQKSVVLELTKVSQVKDTKPPCRSRVVRSIHHERWKSRIKDTLIMLATSLYFLPHFLGHFYNLQKLWMLITTQSSWQNTEY